MARPGMHDAAPAAVWLAGHVHSLTDATCIAEWAIQPMCESHDLPNVIAGTLGRRRRTVIGGGWPSVR